MHKKNNHIKKDFYYLLGFSLIMVLLTTIILKESSLFKVELLTICPLSVVLKQQYTVTKKAKKVLWISGEEMGEGKTHRAIEEIVETIRTHPKSKILILLPDHSLSKDIVERLAKKGIFATHLKGWEKICPKYKYEPPKHVKEFIKTNLENHLEFQKKFRTYQKNNYEIRDELEKWLGKNFNLSMEDIHDVHDTLIHREVVKLYSKNERYQYSVRKGRKNALKRPPSISQICGLFCDEKKQNSCIYHTQCHIKEGYVGVAPQAFIHTPIVKEISWTAIYVDDIDILSYSILPPIKDLDEIFQILTKRYAFTVMRKLGIKPKPFYKLSQPEFYTIIKEIEEKSKRFYFSLIEQNKLQNWLFYNKGKLHVYRFVLINPDIDAYKYYWTVRNTYNWRVPRVVYPNIFILLDKIKSTKITLLGRQTPAREFLLQMILDKYKKEFNNHIKLENLPTATNPNKPPMGMVYHLCTESRGPRTTLRRNDRKSTRERWDLIISTHMRDLRKKGMYIGRIGVIIFKEFGNERWLKNEFPLIFKQFKLRDIEVLTYGRLRGVNHFVKVDFAIIFGAYTVNHRELKINHNLIFLEKHQQLNLGKVKPLGTEKTGFYYDFEKYPTLEMLRQYREWDETTQAIGRSVMRGIDTIIVGDVADYLITSLGDNYVVPNFVPDPRSKARAYINMTSHNHKIMRFLADYYLDNTKRKMTFPEIHDLLQKEGFYIKKRLYQFSADLKKLTKGSKHFSWEKSSKGKVGRPKNWLVFT